ncbi:MAG TPA: hypothetical protein VFA43_18520 [Gemmatimonadaceae bacterium]|nr:hypothetical protein [Gemmatimonadaceae bacterium]
MREQIVRCRTSTDARIYVPARINGVAVQLIFSNATPDDCFVFQSYATDTGLSVVNELSAVGRTITSVRASFGGEYRGGDPPIAGYLNAAFLKDGIVAIDPSVAAIAFAMAREPLSLANPVARLALDGDSVEIPSGSFAVAYQMASFVAQRFLGDKRPNRNGRAEVEVSLADGVTVTQSVAVRPESKSKFDGILGADLLCRWITVFDFPARELLLFSYD